MEQLTEKHKEKILEYIAKSLEQDKFVHVNAVVRDCFSPDVFLFGGSPRATLAVCEICDSLGLIKTGPARYEERPRTVIAPSRERSNSGIVRIGPLIFGSGGLLSPSDLETAPELDLAPEFKRKPSAPKKPKVKATESVILDAQIKEEIYAAISQAEYEKKIFVDWGFNEVFEKGKAITLLFYGQPGTGKTMMAEMLAKDLDTELRIIGAAELRSSEPGGTERAIQTVFRKAMSFFADNQKHQIILFDECDSLLANRSRTGSIESSQINTLLTSIERHEGIVILTTNRVEPLDPALERRITAKIQFPFPTQEQRELIWKRFIPEKAPLGKDVDFKKLAAHNLAGGNIKNCVLNAVRFAAYTKARKLKMAHFTKAVEREVASKKAFEEEQKKRRFRGFPGGYSEDFNKEEFMQYDFSPAKIMKEIKFTSSLLREKTEKEIN